MNVPEQRYITCTLPELILFYFTVPLKTLIIHSYESIGPLKICIPIIMCDGLISNAYLKLVYWSFSHFSVFAYCKFCGHDNFATTLKLGSRLPATWSATRAYLTARFCGPELIYFSVLRLFYYIPP